MTIIYPNDVNETDAISETDAKQWLTVGEVAERFMVTERTVQLWIKQGLFPGTLQATQRGHYRIPSSAVEHFEKSRRVN